METLLAKDPDFSNGWNFLGWLYNKQGRYKLAAIALLKAIEANPFDPYAYNNLGQALAGQKKYEEALPQYLKQIEINKGDVYAYGNLGRVYLELNQNQKAQRRAGSRGRAKCQTRPLCAIQFGPRLF